MKATERIAHLRERVAERERAKRERAERAIRVFADGIRRRAKVAVRDEERYKRFRERNG